jgi:capsular polysaccharide biosynthesis protein
VIPDGVDDLRAAAAAGGPDLAYFPRSPARRSLPAPPRFTFGPFPAATAARYYAETWEWETGLYVGRGLEVVGPYLPARRGTLLACPELYLHRDSLAAMLRAPGPSPGLREVAGACVLLAGPGHRIWGHWLVDFLPRLAVLREAGYDLDRLTYLLPDDTPAWADAWLALFGIPAGRILRHAAWGERIRPERLLIPTTLRTNSRTTPAFAPAVRTLRALLAARHNLSPPPGGTPPRIFVSRALSGREGRSLRNRARIEALAAEAGFAIVHPEHMPLLDQVRLFAHARQVIGEYGSALHATLFGGPGVVVAALRGDGSPVAGFLQSAIGHALRQPTGYVFGSTVDDTLESFAVEEADLRHCLTLAFGDTMALQPAASD